jgi:spore coat protein CotF
LNDNLSPTFPQDGPEKAANYLNIKHSPRLTSSEGAQLWISYVEHTMLRCQWKYFIATTKSSAIKEIEIETLGRIEHRIKIITQLLEIDNLSLPVGFTDNDINIDAPPLFSETFLLHFLRIELKTSLTFNSLNIGMSTRPDVRDFFSACVESSIRLNTKVTDLMVSEGILAKPPAVSIADGNEFINGLGFLSGFIGEKRPLLTIELAHLYNNALANDIGRILLMGFKQVAPSKEVQKFMEKGIQLCGDFIDTLSAKAMEDNINLTLIHDSGVTTSTISPFSEKLMLFHIAVLNAKAIGEYGVSIAASMRHDLIKTYAQMMIEAGKYSEQCSKYMMKKGWLEEPPQVPNWEVLAKHKH